MKTILVWTCLFAAPAFAQYSGSYADRSREIEEQSFKQMKTNEITRARENNARMVAATESYAQSKGEQVQPGTLKCPVRRDMYWYGFNVPSDDDAYSSIQYQYCEFNVGSDACTVGEAYSSESVYVSCVNTNGAKTAYQVAANGHVSVAKKDGDESAPKVKRKHPSRKR